MTTMTTMTTQVFEDYQKQAYDWQKKFVDTWAEVLPTTKSLLTFPEGFEKALKVQEEMVNSYLEVQEKTNKMMLDAQKQFWSDYFEAAWKVAPAKENTTNY